MTQWTVTHQASLSMGFSRQEQKSGWPCPLPEDLPNAGIEPRSPALQVDSLPSEPPVKPILQKVKKINVDHIGKVARDNNTISSSFVKVTWN